MNSIPEIDFDAYSLEKNNPVDLTDLGGQFCSALEEIGFCYLKNHGISEQLIKDVMEASQAFFELPLKEKETCYQSQSYINGWVPLESESLNPSRPAADYKECFHFTPEVDNLKWPSSIPQFESSIKTLYERCAALSQRIFDVISVGLNLDDPNFLRDCHRLMGKPGGMATLRSLYYPSLSKDPKEGQVRCGEHSDYGTLTLLFQDMNGGLEVKNSAGEWIPATPIPGTIVINVGDLMQRWTSDKLIATKHRVLIPSDEVQKQQSRQSIAFFVDPDKNVMIECLDKSNKYPPIKTCDYLDAKFKATY